MIRKRVAALAVVLIFAAAIIAGCGGGGSSPENQILSGSVLTPGGTTSSRVSEAGSADFGNISVAAPIAVYAVDSNGTQTLAASGNTDTNGNFSIVLPVNYNYVYSRLIVSATVDSTQMREFVTGSSGIQVSPISEASVNAVEQHVNQSGGGYGNLSNSNIRDIKTVVANTLASEDFSGFASLSDAVAHANTVASQNASVQAAVSGALSSTGGTLAVVITNDGTTGVLATMELCGDHTSAPTVNTYSTIDEDSIVVTSDDYVYVIGRYNTSSISVFDPSNNMSLVKQYSVGDGSNPHDIEIISSTKAYVTRYELGTILIVNPNTGDELGTIDLSGVDTTDGIPEMDSMVRVGNKVFVTVQRLDRNNYWSASGPGLVVVIDTETDEIIDVDPSTDTTDFITLRGYNPSVISYSELYGKIFISCAGDYFNASVTGGIDTVDPDSYATAHLIDKADLAGSEGDTVNPGEILVISATKGYAVVSINWSTTVLVAFDPSGQSSPETIYQPGGYINTLSVDPYGYLLVPERNTSNPGIVFINTIDNSVTGSIVNMGLPPSGSAIVAY
ncbi:MAG TPA: hypothetical protein PLN69_03750 [bacterium]|nr:hypothetical protein [bacterium]